MFRHDATDRDFWSRKRTLRDIDLTVEAEVTEANCGQTLNVQALELLSDRRLRSRDMSLTLPDCSQAGEFLVLNNLLSDLTIAAK